MNNQILKAIGVNASPESLFMKLYEKPRKQRRGMSASFIVPKKGMVQQADLLFLPKDGSFRYLLVVVDPYDRSMDAQPIKEKGRGEILKAFNKIYKRQYLNAPKYMIQVDAGSEFTGVVKDYFTDKHVIVKVAKVGRHKQQAKVEAMNKIIGKAVQMKINYEELGRNQTSTGNWAKLMPKIVAEINKNVKEPKEYKSPATLEPKCGKKCELLEQGAKVRVSLEGPIDPRSGKRLGRDFRAGDIRFDPTVREIKKVILSPQQPVMYLLDGPNGTLGVENVAYTRNELQLVGPNDIMHKLRKQRKDTEKHEVVKLIGNRVKNREIEFKVKWRDGPSTWEKYSELYPDIPNMIDRYVKKNKVKTL